VLFPVCRYCGEDEGVGEVWKFGRRRRAAYAYFILQLSSAILFVFDKLHQQPHTSTSKSFQHPQPHHPPHQLTTPKIATSSRTYAKQEMGVAPVLSSTRRLGRLANHSLSVLPQPFASNQAPAGYIWGLFFASEGRGLVDAPRRVGQAVTVDRLGSVLGGVLRAGESWKGVACVYRKYVLRPR
jgi:hypothetical protein